MQSSQNSVGVFRVFKPTILFQAPSLPSIQQLLLQPEFTGSPAIWNQAIGPLSYPSLSLPPPPTSSNHVPHIVQSSYVAGFNQNSITYVQSMQSNLYSPNHNVQLESSNTVTDVVDTNNTTKDAATTTSSPPVNCKSRKKKFPCPLCDVRCSNNGQLQGHMRIHTGEKPYQCNYDGCDRRFARNEELTRHKRIHTGFRPHKCETCQKAFGRKDHLNKHQKTHLQEAEKKVFVCEFRGCKQRYSRSDALTRHQCTAHSITTSKPFVSRTPRSVIKPEKQDTGEPAS